MEQVGKQLHVFLCSNVGVSTVKCNNCQSCIKNFKNTSENIRHNSNIRNYPSHLMYHKKNGSIFTIYLYLQYSFIIVFL